MELHSTCFQLDDGLSIKRKHQKDIFKSVFIPFEEPTNLLKQEVREPAIYNAIITAIATGGTKLSEISSKVGEDTSVLQTYIRNLISLGIVKKRNTVRRKAPAEKQSTQLKIICSVFGIALWQKTLRLFQEVRTSLLIRE